MQLFIYENTKNEWKHKSSQIILPQLAKEFNWGELTYSENGKPLIENGFISVSHTKHLLLIAYESFPIGIDCEFDRPISDLLIKRLNLNPANPLKDWCTLEAWIKLDDKPKHLTEAIPNHIIVESLELPYACTCICASYQKIKDIKVIKKD